MLAGLAGLPAHAAPIVASSDYGPAEWVPANPANYTVSNRPASYQVNYIVIHDIEGSVDDAITQFEDPTRAGSAHYIVGEAGGIWQMVAEKDIAWHAGNWDYNTRAIGIEHEGFASCSYCYTTAEYNTSARLAASICSRWGVPLDRSHVIGHYEVPDPNNPGLYGGEEHHTDPGPYWDWAYYMSTAQAIAATLPSPPHMGPDPFAAAEESAALVSWQPAQTCHKPITGYTVVMQPGNVTFNVPAGQTSLWVPGLTDGASYSFTVTATNPDGTSTLPTNSVIPGPACRNATVSASLTSPQPAGTSVTVTASSGTCARPQYRFWLRTPAGTWFEGQDYSSATTWTWNTAGAAPGNYEFGVWARNQSSGHDFDSYAITSFQVGGPTCLATSMSPSVSPPQPVNTSVTFTATSTGCAAPVYQFWVLPPGGSWTVAQSYSTTATWSFSASTAGTYQVGVWAKSPASAGAYDAYYILSYVVGPGGGCVAKSISSSVAQPQPVGASVTFTAQQTGCTGQYQFWLLPPGGSWTVVRSYAASASWTWNTAGASPGVYEVGVWAGSSASPSTYASYAIASFALGVPTCSSASLASNVASPQTAGTSVNFTASSTGCGSPSYEYWLLAPGGSWTVQRGYGSAAWSWSTAGLAAGVYQVGVWALQSGSTAAYDAYFIESFVVAGPPCGSAVISASPASPQPSGSTVMFTASSTGCTSPLYEFLGEGPGGVWEVVQPYSSSPTFTWTSAGSPAGAYKVAVWALAQASGGDYDSYAISTYSLT